MIPEKHKLFFSLFLLVCPILPCVRCFLRLTHHHHTHSRRDLEALPQASKQM